MTNLNNGNNWTKTFKNSDGSYDSFSWSLGDSFSLGFTKIIAAIILGMVVSLIIPIIILLIVPIQNQSDRRGGYILGIIVCIVTICDYHFGWIGWGGWSTLPEIYDVIIRLTFSLLTLNILMLLFERNILSSFSGSKFPILLYYGFIILFIGLTFNTLCDIPLDLIDIAIPSVEPIVEVDSWGLPIK